MRFLADMNVAVSVVDWLRAQGFDAWHLREKGLQRLENGKIFQLASEEGRIVLTFDLDFSEILSLSDGETSAIVFRLRIRGSQHVIRRLATVLEESEDGLEKGAIVSVEDWRHRLRPLPLRRVD